MSLFILICIILFTSSTSFVKIFYFVVSKVWRVTLKVMRFKRIKKKRKMSNISYYNHLKNKSNTRGVEIGLQSKEVKEKKIN